METITLEFFRDNGVLLAIVVGLTQVTKSYVPERCIALVPLVFGIALSLAVNGVSVLGVLMGLTVGLSAGGFYDQKKLVTK